MLDRLVCSPSDLLLLRNLLRPCQPCLHFHELDMDGLLCIDCLLQSLDSGGYRIPCSCRRSSCRALLQTLVMPQRRSHPNQTLTLSTFPFFLLLPSLLRLCSRKTGSVMLRDSSIVRRCRTVLAADATLLSVAFSSVFAATQDCVGEPPWCHP